jgi:RNA polymerase sigma factor (TIGR02999 family)
MAPATHELTKLLKDWGAGDKTALDKLMPLVHDELHRLARQHMRREKPGHLLQTSALVNEAYLRLVDASQVDWQNRAQFFGIAARLMRRILIDDARRRHRDKRGGGAVQVPLDAVASLPQAQAANLISLDEALNSLSAIDPRQSEVVELRFFGGMSIEETAEVLKVSPGTVARDWTFARAWLRKEMGGDGQDRPSLNQSATFGHDEKGDPHKINPGGAGV